MYIGAQGARIVNMEGIYRPIPITIGRMIQPGKKFGRKLSKQKKKYKRSKRRKYRRSKRS
jgi:uncharacterized membrane protein YoaK (UPF0700 family)